MQKRWLNEKQPDENGDYILVLENEKGGRVSTFKGQTIDEVCEKLADSQMHANLEMIRLRKPDTARPKLRLEQKQLSPADRLRLSTEMTDPERVVEAVEEIVTARQGITPNKLGAHLSEMDEKERDEYYQAEATAFRDEHPNFYPVPQNRDALFEEMRANGWDLTRNNLAIAFRTLWDRGDMIPWPDDSGNNPTPPTPINGDDGGMNGAPATTQPAGHSNGGNGSSSAPSPRPRNVSVSTGLRSSDASASAPAPVKRAAKYTRADIDRMSRAEFADKLRNEPGFRQQIDAMSA